MYPIRTWEGSCDGSPELQVALVVLQYWINSSLWSSRESSLSIFLNKCATEMKNSSKAAISRCSLLETFCRDRAQRQKTAGQESSWHGSGQCLFQPMPRRWDRTVLKQNRPILLRREENWSMWHQLCCAMPYYLARDCFVVEYKRNPKLY